MPSPSEVPLEVLPEGINEQQLGIEAFNYIDHGSESKFRGELVSYDLNNIKVSWFCFFMSISVFMILKFLHTNMNLHLYPDCL